MVVFPLWPPTTSHILEEMSIVGKFETIIEAVMAWMLRLGCHVHIETAGQRLIIPVYLLTFLRRNERGLLKIKRRVELLRNGNSQNQVHKQ